MNIVYKHMYINGLKVMKKRLNCFSKINKQSESKIIMSLIVDIIYKKYKEEVC